MRDVKSKNFYEQMMGRGTRTQNFEDLRQVTPSALHNKDSFVLIDAVGVTESKKLDSRPLERKPSKTLKDLMTAVVTGERGEDTLTSIASRFIKLNMQLTDEEKREAKELSGGENLNNIAENLLNAFDVDYIFDNFNNDEEKVNKFIEQSVNPIFNPEFRNFIEEARKNHEQIIDEVNPDTVLFSDWQSNSVEQSQNITDQFEKYISDNLNQFDALQIIYNTDYQNRQLMYGQVKELHKSLTSHGLNESTIWGAYYTIGKTKNKPIEVKLADLIQLVKFGYGQIEDITPFSADVKRKYRDWIVAKNSELGSKHFTKEQSDWLQLIRDFIATNVSISDRDLDYGQLAERGGLGQFYQLFGQGYKQLLREVNFALAA
jgi:type I restriction enzyme R subunit